MLTDFVAKPVPAPALPLVAHSKSSRGHDSATALPWLETVGHRSASSCRAGEGNQDVVAGWLKALGLSFGSCVRMIDVNRELTLSGGGSVCRTLDGFCGQRAACRQTHRTLHAAAFERGCTQQLRCPFGFLLVSVAVRVKESWQGQIEFGPLGVERIDRVEFERCLSRFGFTVSILIRFVNSAPPIFATKRQLPVGASAFVAGARCKTGVRHAARLDRI